MKPAILLFLFFLLISCKHKQLNTLKSNTYHVRIEATFGDMFCKLYVNEDSRARVIKGYYTSSNLINYTVTDTSKVFKLDSIRQFFVALRQVAAKPYNEQHPTGDTPAFRIYYNEAVVYYGSGMREQFWRMFRPILTQIPGGYNPFYQQKGNPWWN